MTNVKFIFKKNIFCAHESYDVFDKSYHQVAYVRLRWGHLICECPDIGGELIYSADVGDWWTGCFTSSEERTEHLQNIAEKIEEWYTNQHKCNCQ